MTPALDDFNYNYIADDADLDNRLEQFRVYQGGPPQTEALSTSRDYSSNLSDLVTEEPAPAPVKIEPLSSEAEPAAPPIELPAGATYGGRVRMSSGTTPSPTTRSETPAEEPKPTGEPNIELPAGATYGGRVTSSIPKEPPKEESDFGWLGNIIRDADRETRARSKEAVVSVAQRAAHVLSADWRLGGHKTLTGWADKIDEVAEGWKDFEEGNRPAMTMEQAYKAGGKEFTTWLAGQAAAGAVNVTMYVALARLTGIPGLIAYGMASGAAEEARRGGHTPESVTTAAVLGGAEFGAPLGVYKYTSQIGNMAKRVAASVLGQAAVGTAGTYAHPVVEAVADPAKGYVAPTPWQAGESAVVSGGMGVYAPGLPKAALPLDIPGPVGRSVSSTDRPPPPPPPPAGEAPRPPRSVEPGAMPTEQGVLPLARPLPETSTEAFPRTRLEIDTDPRQGELPGTEMTQPDLPGVRQPPVRLDTRTPEELALRPEPSGRTLESPTSEALPRADLPGQLEMPGTGPRGVLEEGPASPMRDPAVQAATEAAVNPRGARPSEPPDPRQGEMFPQGQLPLVERPGERPVQLDQRTPEEVAAAQAPPEPTARAREPDLTGQRELELEQPLPFQPDIRTDVRAAEAPRPEPVQGELPLETPTPAPAPEAAAKPATRTQIRQRLAELGATKQEIQASNRSSIAQAREDLAQREGAAKPVEAPVEAPVPAGPQLRRAAPAPEAQAPTPAPAEPAPAPAERRPTIARPRPRRTVEVGGRGEAATAEEQPPLTEKTLSLLRRKEARATGERTSTENLGRTSSMAEEAAGQLREEAEQTLPGSQVAREVPIEEIESAKTMPTREGGLVETRSPTTTDMRLKYTDALHDFLQGTKDIDEALKAVPTQEAGTRGRPRREAGLADYLEKFAIPRAIKNELADQLARKRVTEIIDKHGRGEITTATRDRLIQKHVDQMKVRAEKRGPKQELERENLSQLRQVAEFLRKIAKDEKGSLDLDRLGELWRELRERGGPVIGAPSRRELSQNDLAESRNRTERRVADLETVAAEKLIERINKPASDLGHNDSLQDYMRDVINDPSSRILTPDIHELINHMLRLLPDPIPVGTFEGLGRRYNNARLTASEGKSPGGYMPDLDMVAFSKNFGNRAPAETVAHEAIHAVTSPYLKYLHEKVANSRQPAWETLTPTEYRHYKVIEAIREEASNIAHFEDLNREEFRTVDYAIQGKQRGQGGGPETGQQGHELLSMFMTNPEAQAVMARSQTSPNFRASLRAAGYKGNVSNIWSAFKEWVKDVIGYRKGSVLDRVLDPFTDIMEAGAAHREYLKTGWQKDMQSGIDFAPIAAPRQRRTTGSERSLTSDNLVGEQAREQMRPFGELMRDLMGDQRGTLQLPDNVAERLRAHWPGMNTAALKAVTAVVPKHIMARHNRDVLPAGEDIFAAQGRTQHETDAWRQRYGDRVQALAHRSNEAPHVFELLKEASLNKTFLGNDIRDFDARNAHLNETEMRKARELRAQFDRLPEHERRLYQDQRNYFAEVNAELRVLEYKDALKRSMPGVPEAELDMLAEKARTKTGIESVIADPDTVAKEMFAERYQHSPALARELALIQRHGFTQGDYAPLSRPNGQHVLTYGEPGTPSYGVEYYKRSHQAVARQAQLRAQGVDVSEVLSRSWHPTKTQAMPPQELLDGVVREMTKRGADKKDIERTKEALLHAILRNAANSASAQARLRRNYVRGANKEGAETLWDFFSSTTARAGHLTHGADEAAAFRDARAQVSQLERASGVRAPAAEIAQSRARLADLEQRFAAKDPAVSQADIEHARRVHRLLETPPSGSQVRRAREVLTRLESARSTDPDASSQWMSNAAGKATTMSFLYHIVRPAHLALQTVLDHGMGTSILGGHYGYGRAVKAIGRNIFETTPGTLGNFRTALRAAHGGMRYSDWNMSHALAQRSIDRAASPVEKNNITDLYNAASDMGMFRTLVRESQALASPGGFEFGKPASGGNWTNLPTNMMNLWAAAEHSIESHLRWTMLKSGYDLARGRGASHQQAMREATRYASEFMPIYGQWNAPALTSTRGPLGQLTPASMQFKQYGLNILATQGAYVREAMGRGPEAHEARKTLAGMLAMQSVLAGATINLFPLPVSLALGAWDMFFGEGDKPHDYEVDLRRWITEMVGPDNQWLATLASTGLLGLLGIDARRTGKMSNLADVPELRSFDGKGVGQWLVQALTGASGSTMEQLMDGTHELLNGDPLRAAAKLAPRIIGDPIRAYQLSEEGIVNRQGHTVMGPGGFTGYDVALRGLGFRPYAESQPLEQRYAMESRQDVISTRRARAVREYLRTGDLSAVVDYNNEFRSISPLTPQHLRQAKADEIKRQRDPDSLGMKIPKRARQDYLEHGNFR